MSAFTIASWNVHMGLHNDHAGARDTVNHGPLNDVVAGCVAIDADVLVLQEAGWWTTADTPEEFRSDRDLIDDVAAATGGVSYRYIGDRPNRYPLPWTIAVISRLPMTRLDDLVLPALKNCQRAMLRLQLDDHDLVIGAGHHDGIHAVASNPRLWREQMRVLRKASSASDIIVGDMNMWGPVLTRTMPSMRRAVVGRTWPATRPHSQIDHILVNDRVEVLDGNVLANMNSDHRPIKARLRRS